MRSMKAFSKIYFYRPFVDFRKGIRSLAILIQDQMELDPFQPALFIFSSKSRDRVKVVYWDRNRFALWYKQILKKMSMNCLARFYLL